MVLGKGDFFVPMKWAFMISSISMRGFFLELRDQPIVNCREMHRRDLRLADRAGKGDEAGDIDDHPARHQEMGFVAHHDAANDIGCYGADQERAERQEAA